MPESTAVHHARAIRLPDYVRAIVENEGLHRTWMEMETWPLVWPFRLLPPSCTDGEYRRLEVGTGFGSAESEVPRRPDCRVCPYPALCGFGLRDNTSDTHEQAVEGGV